MNVQRHFFYIFNQLFFLSSNVQNISRKNHKSVDVNFNSV